MDLKKQNDDKRRAYKVLQQFPPDTPVAVYDWEKNANDDTGDGSSAGVYSDFEVDLIRLEEDEAAFYREEHGKDFSPWIAIGFKNEEYERSCRVCGCTEDNCQQCIEKTGQPCHWVEEDLCSACAPQTSASQPLILLPGRDF
jgi:hypothetical protein